jgi:hypothetical protein
MAAQDKNRSSAIPVRSATQEPASKGSLPRTAVRTTAARECEDCRATTAFQAWHDAELAASYNTTIDFSDWKLIPKGKRAVLELVTAQIEIPVNEWARLRMFGSLGTLPSNIDLFLTYQGNVGSNSLYVATHALRIYCDSNDIAFNINRDNATTTGYAFVFFSGYIVG